MSDRPRSAPSLPSPGVAFGADYVRRLEALQVLVRGRAERREGAGRSHAAGDGIEFVGFRPYRPGEDLRRLDWNLLGRLDRAFVRVTRRESSERWTVLVDTSASMGVGPPGKLQWAAEVAGAVASIGLDAGATVRVLPSDTGDPRAAMLLRRRSDLRVWFASAETWSAAGESGLPALLEPARLRGADRVIAIGDWLGVEPAALGGVFARGREWRLAHVLAPIEIAPLEHASGGRHGVDWVAAEGAGRASTVLDAEALAHYERELESELEHWSDFAARHRVPYVFRSSASPFEDAALALLG